MNKPIYIGLGSNQENPINQIQSAITEINQMEGIKVIKSSSLYITKPVGLVEQDNFINAVIEVSSSFSPHELLLKLQQVEQMHKRVRDIKWGPRTLDCDLLYYQDKILSDKILTLPHKEILHRAFVLVPLAEIAPNWQHTDGRTMQALVQSCDQSGVQELTRSLELV
jgi:2-amino-4-hydroxy-6-hydroxymethyldihydropteridine diphosphokinase